MLRLDSPLLVSLLASLRQVSTRFFLATHASVIFLLSFLFMQCPFAPPSSPPGSSSLDQNANSCESTPLPQDNDVPHRTVVQTWPLRHRVALGQNRFGSILSCFPFPHRLSRVDARFQAPAALSRSDSRSVQNNVFHVWVVSVALPLLPFPSQAATPSLLPSEFGILGRAATKPLLLESAKLSVECCFDFSDSTSPPTSPPATAARKPRQSQTTSYSGDSSPRSDGPIASVPIQHARVVAMSVSPSLGVNPPPDAPPGAAIKTLAPRYPHRKKFSCSNMLGATRSATTVGA